jgi:hypothetical protein
MVSSEANPEGVLCNNDKVNIELNHNVNDLFPLVFDPKILSITIYIRSKSNCQIRSKRLEETL